MEADLIGITTETLEDYQTNITYQASSIDVANATQSAGCVYHGSILQMHDSVGGHGQGQGHGLAPMPRWLGEGPAEQCSVLHLHNGQLSIHKDCQCSDVLQDGADMDNED